jgi:endonuclease/exonuclease/phosphatase family metal-dependent hydrolase
MRLDSLNKLKDLLKSHQYPSIALGDFNINSKEDKKFDIYKSEETHWIVSHLYGCKNCKGTHYYGYDKSWSFLDAIFLSKDRGIRYIPDSINVHSTLTNSYSDTGRPIRFNPIEKDGVSDHLPIVAKFEFD